MQCRHTIINVFNKILGWFYFYTWNDSTDIRLGYSLSVVIFYAMVINSCCANGMDVRMCGFSDSLPLCTRIRKAYNAGEMWTRALSRRENWTPILVVRGVVTIRLFAI